MERENGNKALRVLSMYQKLMNNQIVNKAEEAAAYGVNSRTIQRNIDDIRGFLETTDSAGISKQIVYDQKERGYRLEEVYDENLTAGEALDVCKILIDSRAFPKDKMKKLIYQIVGSSVPEPEQKHILNWSIMNCFITLSPDIRQTARKCYGRSVRQCIQTTILRLSISGQKTSLLSPADSDLRLSCFPNIIFTLSPRRYSARVSICGSKAREIE